MATARLKKLRKDGVRVVIVGAGPAGTRCAETLVAAGVRPILLDENRRDGGQIYRRQPEGFSRDYATLYGSEAHKARALHQSFDTLDEALKLIGRLRSWPVVEPNRLQSGASYVAALRLQLVTAAGAAGAGGPVDAIDNYLATVPNAGHWVQYEAADAFVAALLGVLQRP